MAAGADDDRGAMLLARRRHDGLAVEFDLLYSRPVTHDRAGRSGTFEEMMIELAPHDPIADRPPPACLENVALELLGSVGAARAESLEAFAEAWDAGQIRVASLLPRAGRIGSLEDSRGLTDEAVGFLACAGLRPHLESWLETSRAHLDDGAWERGACPFCGGPPGFADILEDGRRRLACCRARGALDRPAD